MEFIEAPAFTRYLYDYLTEDEYAGLQGYLAIFPEAGAKVPNGGGVRKLRWEMANRGIGKRGGVRIIYFYHMRDSEIWLLTIYSKNEKATIPPHILRKIAREFENG